MHAHTKTCLCICRWMRPHGATRAGTQAPPLPTSIKPLYHAIFLDFVHRRLFSSNLMTRTIREMVGAAPVCPPERPRSGVSMRKKHIHIRKSGVSIHKRCMLTPKYISVFPDGCALMGRHGRARRHQPYQPPSNPSATQSSSF